MNPGMRLPFRPFVFKGDSSSLRGVEDEVLVVLTTGQDTSALAATCYGVAVRKCLRVAESVYLLKFRPDLRPLLLSQLDGLFSISRIYRSAKDGEQRFLLTDKISVRWASYASAGQVRDALGRYFPDLAEAMDVHDAIYPLTPRFAGDPLLVVQALEMEPLVLRAAPVVVAIPVPAPEDAAVDLLPVA